MPSRWNWILAIICGLSSVNISAQNFAPAVLSADQNLVKARGDGPAPTPLPTFPPQVPITVPAGTHVMVVLVSPLHTTSGVEGSGIYAETLYPVIYDDRVVIPARSQVQGVVDGNQRPGHLHRTAEFKFRFTNLIFPNNHLAAIDGLLAAVPGSRNTRSQSGTVRTVDQTEKVITPAAAGAAGGALLGSVNRLGVGKFVGAGLGAGLGAGAVLLHRGDEISLARGTYMEVVLQRPLVLDGEQASFNAHYVPGSPGQTLAQDRSDDLHGPARSTIRQRRPIGPAWPRFPLFR